MSDHDSPRAGSPAGSARASPPAVRTALIGKAVEVVPLLLLLTVVPRALGPSAYGRFAVAWAAVTVGSAALSASGAYVMARYVAAVPEAERPATARALAGPLAAWYALEATAVLVAAGIATALLDLVAPAAAAVVLAALVLDLFAALAFQVALGLGVVAGFAFRFAIQNAVLVVAVLASAPLSETWGPPAAVLAGSASILGVGAAIVLPALRRAPTGAPRPPDVRRFAVAQAAGELLDHATYRGPVLVVALLAGSPVQNGYVGIAGGAATAVLFTASQVFAMQMVELARDAHERDDRAVRTGRRLAWYGVLVLVPLAALGVTLLEPLLVLAAGEEFAAARAALVPVLAMLPLAPPLALATQAAALRLQPERRLVAAAGGAATFVVASALAVPRYAAVGATAALLASVTITLLAATALIPRAFGARLVTVTLAGSALVLLLGVRA